MDNGRGRGFSLAIAMFKCVWSMEEEKEERKKKVREGGKVRREAMRE